MSAFPVPAPEAPTPFPFRVLRLHIENMGKIEILDITPPEDVVVITGENEAGKSTVLDCVRLVLEGGDTFTDDMIRDGADRGLVEVDLGTGTDVEYTVTRERARGFGMQFRVAPKKGKAPKSPGAWLRSLSADSPFVFDLSAFERMKIEDLDALLRQIAGVDTTAFDATAATARATRTKVGQEHKAALALLGPPIEAPDEEVSIDALLEEQQQLTAARDANATRRQAASELVARVTRGVEVVATAAARVQQLRDDLAGAEAAARAQSEKLEALTAESMDAQTALATLTDPDLSALTEQIRTASVTNDRVRAKRERAARETAAAAKAAQYEQLTADIAATEQQIATALAGAQLPIDGLSLTVDGWKYNGGPLSRASKSGRRKLALRLNKALKPQIRVAMFHDADSLDGKSRAAVIADCREARFQVWFEDVLQGEALPGSFVIVEGKLADVPALPAAVEQVAS